MTSSPRDRHLDARTVLDYLDQHIDAASRRAVDEHLARPCAACRERVREAGELLETMRLDRSADVPAWLHERARDVFSPAARVPSAQRLVESLAQLVFDSLALPQAAAVRRAVGEARRLRFSVADRVLDLELERESASTCSLRGRLQAEDPALWTLEVACGDERFLARPDDAGAFVIESLPAGPLDVSVEGPGERFRLPAIEP